MQNDLFYYGFTLYNRYILIMQKRCKNQNNKVNRLVSSIKILHVEKRHCDFTSQDTLTTTCFSIETTVTFGCVLALLTAGKTISEGQTLHQQVRFRADLCSCSSHWHKCSTCDPAVLGDTMKCVLVSTLVKHKMDFVCFRLGFVIANQK